MTKILSRTLQELRPLEYIKVRDKVQRDISNRQSELEWYKNTNGKKYFPHMYEILTKHGVDRYLARKILVEDFCPHMYLEATVLKYLPPEVKDEKKARAGKLSVIRKREIREAKAREELSTQSRSALKMALPRIQHNTTKKDGYSTQIVNKVKTGKIRIDTDKGLIRFILAPGSYAMTLNKDGELVSMVPY